MNHDVQRVRGFAEDLAGTGAVQVMSERARVAGADPWRQGTLESGADDHVTSGDLHAERAIRTRVASLRPDDVVHGEHDGGPEPGGGQVQWLVDPICGTGNFRSGLPVYAVSVAARVDGITIAAAVAEPATGRLWSAALGEGARLYDPRLGDRWWDIRVGSTRDLADLVLATGFSRRAQERIAQYRLLGRVIGRIADLRRSGSPAVDLCWVAAGAVDAFVQHHLNPWAWAAGALIAEEAGAVVHLPDTSRAAARLGDPVFAAAPGVADGLVDLLDAAGARSLIVDRPRPGPDTVAPSPAVAPGA